MKMSVEIPSYPSINARRHLSQMLALILALVVSPAAVGAGIYKWTDANGNVTYGSQRPEDAPAEKMNLYVPGPATPPAPQQ